MNPIDWTLITIATAGERPLQPVQLQKSLFLLGQNLAPEQLQTDLFYRFEAYDYGPFSNSVYADAEALEHAGLVVIHRPPKSRYKLYGVSEAGRKRANELESGLDEKVIEYVRDVVQFTQSVSFNQLVSAIYKKYPEMKANSVFRE